jgi:signal transduction histidine kinase
MPSPVAASLDIPLAVALGVAVLGAILVLAARTRGMSRRLRRLAGSLESAAGNDLSADVPEEGPEAVAMVARSVNRFRREAAARVDQLERNRDALGAILSALEEGILLFDREGQVLYQNQAAVRLLGGPVPDARSLSPPALREVVQRRTQGDGIEVTELPAGPPGRTLRVAARSIGGRDGLLLVVQDVTEARSSEAVRRDFVANASHELKTPVAAIQALAETIAAAAEDDPGTVSRFSEQLEREAGRLSRVIADLLDLSRLEGEAGERAEVRFDSIAADEADRHRRRAERAGVSVEVTTDGPVSVIGSARDLALLVRNLVENAIQYTRPGGSVSVSVGVDRRGGAVLEVRDSGIGIPSKDQSRIFERFYRVDRARSRQTGGTGLGLSIVKHVAENHGGTVTVESELGRGSTFTVRLPVAG